MPAPASPLHREQPTPVTHAPQPYFPAKGLYRGVSMRSPISHQESAGHWRQDQGVGSTLLACLWVQRILLRCKATNAGADGLQAAVLRLPKLCIDMTSISNPCKPLLCRPNHTQSQQSQAQADSDVVVDYKRPRYRSCHSGAGLQTGYGEETGDSRTIALMRVVGKRGLSTPRAAQQMLSACLAREQRHERLPRRRAEWRLRPASALHPSSA